MSLRARLGLAFALFAAVPLAAALVPVSRALSASLAAEHAARLDRAALAVEGELDRLAAGASVAVRELAGGPEAEALARDLASGTLDPATAQELAAGWMTARGLDVLAVLDPEGRVIASGHMPGRAGDLDPDAARLTRLPAGRAAAALVERAGPDGVARVLAQVAWFPLAGPGGLRLAGGLALGPERAARLAALTGGSVRVTAPDGAELAAAEAASPELSPLARRVQAVLGGPGLSARPVRVGAPGAEAGTVEVRLGSAGLWRAQLGVLAAFLSALLLGSLAAGIAGALLARRVTSPIDALRAAAARVAAGELGARVGVTASGEVGELVTAFDAMSAELALGRARLAQAERVAAWREVARRLAHEIKNPLTPIAMSVETLRDAKEAGRADFGEIFDESTRAIGEEVRRLKKIVDEFGRFARLPPPERAPASPEDLVQAVLALFPEPPAGVTLRREVEPGLPRVLADRDQVLQVLLNLVRNALEAMGSRGGEVTVSAQGLAEGQVAITVADTGPGVPAEDLPKLFEPYFTTKEGGTGLGLAIARRIAEEHGGALEYRSRAGGAAFTLTLPVAEEQAAAG
ncbi:MAG: ATP-binding protein [Anaeromyxobacteraceae bacterium]